MRAHAPAVPAIERARVHDDDREMLGVGDLRAVFVLHPQHARHRRGVRPPEAHVPALTGWQFGRHGRSLSPAVRTRLGDLGAPPKRGGDDPLVRFVIALTVGRGAT
jgi:hypothetical protein